MSVSRQTISKWEMNQGYPEIPKLVELADVFHCKVDELLRVNLAERMNVYSDVKVTKVPGFTMGRYVNISPNPEDDVHAYMEAWAQRSGLLSVTDGKPVCIGWDFPFVSAQQQNRYGLRGYVSAYILPDGFIPLCSGVEIVSQKETEYASITIRNPFKEHLNIFLQPIRRSWSILMPMDADRISVMNMYAALSMYTRKMI